jgi:hypothetical protein
MKVKKKKNYHNIKVMVLSYRLFIQWFNIASILFAIILDSVLQISEQCDDA